MAEFAPLRTETEKRGAAIKAAAAKRAPPQELCQLFARFLESEGKVVKFMEKNAATCGIPAQVVTATKTNHVKTVPFVVPIADQSVIERDCSGAHEQHDREREQS